MQTLEIALLSTLLLFPLVDLVLEKYKFRNKCAEYIKTSVMLWVVTGFLFFCFLIGVLKIDPPQYLPSASWKGYLAIFMFAVFIGYMKYVLSSIHKDASVRLQVLKAFKVGGESFVEILPTSHKEFLFFTLLVSVSAGVCEELIFRWYLYSFIEQHTGGLVAVIGSSIIFGLWHTYLGWKHVTKTAVVGLLLCGIYLYFESIVVAILAHIFMDVYSGSVAFIARKAQGAELTNA
ncbi:CPBP family intramembrane metalloprotease [Alteromonas pelagimontana]|uniref:CPBP family intramembrane metalloprotease n=1 Tax=Alteromonas pelagimontana TaxID=1858656 RepID=A0A6M4MBN0_9ALTE|nr:CPBP family intramembrane glutamic endopeptidase [Alteromonas pelagimontana]QJR80429.1 CPBP family intramembrane metalloprotease [Alteromonas pelagimontana]